jgi:ketosteroid isomerase-like protein
MAAQNPNVELLKRAYAGWNASKGDTQCWLDIVADDIKLSSLAKGATPLEFTATRHGAEELKSYLGGLLADWTMNFQHFDDFIAEGDRVVAIGNCSWTNKRTGKSVETPKVDIWRFRDGKAVEFHEFYDTAGAMAAAQ